MPRHFQVSIHVLNEAARIFEPIELKIYAMYHTMLKGYAHASVLNDALSFFCRMNVDNVKYVVYNFTYLLKFCGEYRDVRRGKEIQGVLIVNGFSGLVFETYKMSERMLVRDLVYWNSMIGGFVQNGLAKEALELVRELHREGLRADQVTVVSVMSCIGGIEALKIGKAMHKFVLRSGLKWVSNLQE